MPDVFMIPLYGGVFSWDRLLWPYTIAASGLVGGAAVLVGKWLYINPTSPAGGASLSLVADFVPMAIALVGIVMSYRTPKKEHHFRTTVILILAGLAGTGIMSWTRLNNERAHREEVNGLNTKLRSVADQNTKILDGFALTKPAAPLSVAPKPTEASRRRNILALLRNEYILSHSSVDPSLLAGTVQPPTEWVNHRLKQLGETWSVEGAPLKVRKWDIMPYAAGKKISARIYIVNPNEALSNFTIVFNRGITPDYVGNYDARKSLEDNAVEPGRDTYQGDPLHIYASDW